jgi:hypothetical protein
VPDRAITVAVPVEEVLITVSSPVAAPAAAGLNPTVNVAVCPGVKVTGRGAVSAIVKPAPVKATASIVTGSVPVEAKVTDWGADAVFTPVIPKAKPLALELNAGSAGLNSRAKVAATPPALAAMVTVWPIPVGEIAIENPTLVAPAGTIAVAGTETVELLLDRFTTAPPAGAGEDSVTVQASIPAPVIFPLVHEIALVAHWAAVPVPLRPITYVAPEDESLVMVSCPIVVPASGGSKRRTKL